MLRSIPSIANKAGTGSWFHISNRVTGGATTCEIVIDSEIGGWGVPASMLTAQIKNIPQDQRIKLHLYSPGGDVLEGNEIANALAAHPGGVDVEIGALCASIATVIACVSDNISIAANGLMMIHNPTTYAQGESGDFRRLADVMDKMKGNILDAYVKRTGMKKAELSDLMDETTWMTATEAKEKGFVHNILDKDADNADIEDRFDFTHVKNFAGAISRVKRTPAPVDPGASNRGNPNEPAETQDEPQPYNVQTLIDNYKMKKLRIFNHIPVKRARKGTKAAAVIPAHAIPISHSAVSPLTGSIKNNGAPVKTGGENIDEQVKAGALALYKAKVARDKEIDDIVVAVRKNDKKDFSNLALEFKTADKTADEFARALVVSDKWTPFEVVGSGSEEPSGIEVLGVNGLAKGTPGELFVASADYRAIVDRMKRGSRVQQSAMIETQGFIAAAMARFLNTTTSSGLTSIEKLPGVVTLGVRPLTVKDLIAPGATTNITIRYIQEQTFTNAAAMVAEGAAKPAAAFALIEVDSPVKKIAVYTKVTDELFADFLAVASYINMRLPYMVERTEEDQLLNGDGTGANLTGILNFAGIQTQAKGADTGPDALYKSMTKVRWGNLAGTAQGGFEPDGIVMHPTDWEALRLMKDGNNQYFGGGPFTGAYGNGQMAQFEMIWGKPVVVTPAIAQGTALTGAFRLASQYFQRQGLTIESTNTDQDDFIKNLTTIRAETRLALAVYRPLAFCQVTGL